MSETFFSLGYKFYPKNSIINTRRVLFSSEQLCHAMYTEA